MTPEELQELLRKSWSRETSFDPEHWTPENPAWYQCGTTTLLAQYFLGGEILGGEAIIKDPEYIHKRVDHFWNRLPGGKEVDFTRKQFPAWTIIRDGKPISRSLLLGIPSLKQKYTLLRIAVEEQIKKKKTAKPSLVVF